MPASKSPYLTSVVILTSLFVFNACKKPEKRSASTTEAPLPAETSPTAPVSEPIPQPVPTTGKPMPVPKTTPKPVVEAPPPKPELPPAPKPIFRPPPKVTSRSVAILKDNSEWPNLILVETEPSNAGENARLSINGEMRSEQEFRTLIGDLSAALPGHKIEVKVTFGNHIRLTNWSDRVSTLWGTFFNQIDNATWSYEDGVTTLRGVADKPFTVESLVRFSEKLMEGSDQQRVDNFLTVQ